VIVACCQHDICWEQRLPNHARVRELLRQAELPAGSLALLPEMFATGFSLDVEAVAETSDRETEFFLSTLARELGLYLIGGVVRRGPDGRGRNQAVGFSPAGAEIVRYTKTHPFTPGGEAATFAAGSGPCLFPWQECLVSPFICYDLRFPEISRPAARAGAHLLTYIASWPEIRIGHWVKLLQARAIENQSWVAGVNRIGTDPNSTYSGRSLIVNPFGDIVADAENRATVIRAELDLTTLTSYRRDKPFLADLRPEFVAPIS
jgi:predicted amidohydrolase